MRLHETDMSVSKHLLNVGRNNCSVSDILVQGEISRQTYKYTSITGKSDQYRENKKDGQITR